MTVGRSTSPTHQQGAQAEDRAASFIQAQGYRLVASNFNTRCGEIDLIAQQGQQLVFVEVRQRKAGALVSALESITVAKQRKIIKAAHLFLQQHPQYRQYHCRFDVIAYTALPLRAGSGHKGQLGQPDPELEWIQAAFYAV